MGFMDKVKDFVAPIEEEDDYQEAPQAEKVEEVDDDEVVRTKSIVPKEMSLDEAIMKMELLGHDFFIYTDDETSKIAVCYKRHDGGYGLIETE